MQPLQWKQPTVRLSNKDPEGGGGMKWLFIRRSYMLVPCVNGAISGSISRTPPMALNDVPYRTRCIVIGCYQSNDIGVGLVSLWFRIQ